MNTCAFSAPSPMTGNNHSLSPQRCCEKLARVFLLLLSLLFLSGCANYYIPKNVAIPNSREVEKYSLFDWKMAHLDNDIKLILSFSGGGTRAAALSYGVLRELRDTNIDYQGRKFRLLDEVDYISSVSGGSFTSAYYGLHGDGIFENFEDEFLRFNLERHLLLRTINPLLLFSRKGRTESAINYYQKFLFHDATFADLINPNRPMIIINASDLGRGIRFSFTQEYFDLLCSDLSAFPVAEAVAASSAVPVLFNPIVIENYDTCTGMQLIGTKALYDAQEFYRNENLPVLISQLESYAQKDKRKFIHFVDGGITDNLGLRALSDIMAVSGGAMAERERIIKRKVKPPRYAVVVMVNAATAGDEEMDESNKEPSAPKVVSAVSSLQLRRYDEDSILMLKQDLDVMAEALSTPEQPVSAYFINVNLQDAEDPKILDFLNRIPTSFALSDEQVDSLIDSGQALLRENPEFQKLLRELNSR